MWDIRELSKEYNKPIIYPKGTGTTEALNLACRTVG